MKKLELEHIAPYLPYGLKVVSKYGEVSEIDSLSFSLDGHERTSLNLMVGKEPKRFRGSNFEYIKPILRPLSDLFELVDYNDGNGLVKLGYKYGIVKDDDDYCEEVYADQCESPKAYIPLESYNFWLFENHFDVFGLIDKGLAIDINTI